MTHQPLETSMTSTTSGTINLPNIGPKFGYFTNGAKSWLVVKEEFLVEAKSLFNDTKIHITSEGRPYLGPPLGSLLFL